MITTRRLTMDDAPALAKLVTANREFLKPWEPARTEEYYTEDGQREVIEAQLLLQASGNAEVHVIELDGELAGRIMLAGIVRGPFHSCSVGYWVASSANGRGVASAAVAAMLRVAFDELGLHRVQAETLLHNHGSQRVLARNGFERIGLAPKFLRIDGEWQDHVLFQVVNEGWEG
ncbi:hypothetical protein Afil01_43070 [Actinorhabdospora filicis]|uniref:N-acetyltransferase domain-containing protein n=1 Tax=Actinorhabdospora filicis TaxID=1785913 RepID=A0A9W6SP87_9ACTN|nr:GNAT family N-acetyltransferase [Actinorhabdospora filicis]GLZ79500.1 hypothetical protein Afil01_43070 [Actinorhabdospora filicis]